MSKRLAVIIGSGDMPAVAVKEALAKGYDFKAYVCDSGVKLPNGKYDLEHIKIEKFGYLLKQLKKDNIGELAIVGKMHKSVLFRNIVFDLKALSILKKMKSKNDHALYNAIAEAIEEKGITILKQTVLLGPLLSEEKVYVKNKMLKTAKDDIEFGLKTAVKMSEMDIGQTVVVSQGTVLAVEAMEGTDETIRRGGALAHKNPAVVCKASRKNQDARFDIPTVGPSTIDLMKKSNCAVLALQAGRTLIVDKEKMIKTAQKANIAVLARNI